MSFTEVADYEKGFKKYYDEKLVPVLSEIKADHDNAYKTLHQRMPPGILLGLLVIAITIYLAVLSHIINPPITLFAIAGIIWWVTSPLRAFKKTVKTRIMQAVCSFYGDLHFNPEGQKDRLIFRCPIFPNYNSISTEDLIEGSYNGGKLSLFEAQLKQRRGKHTATVFRGLVITAEFAKKFSGKTYVKRDEGNRLFNWFEKPAGTEKISLEDPKFEKRFEVYGTDQIEARFLLTTALMERLLNLAESRHGSIQCAFQESNLIIALSSSQNYFEPNITDSCVFDENDLHVFLAQMNSIFQILEILNKR